LIEGAKNKFIASPRAQNSSYDRRSIMPVNKNELDKAIRAAPNGPEVLDVRVAEIDFIKINR
jgi:hypothetical protein